MYGDPTRLHIAPTAVINNALFNLSSGQITVGEYAFFGHNVSVLTGTHDWTRFGAQRQVAVPTSGRDVVIEEGVWVSSHAIVVGPCRIGARWAPATRPGSCGPSPGPARPRRRR